MTAARASDNHTKIVIGKRWFGIVPKRAIALILEYEMVHQRFIGKIVQEVFHFRWIHEPGVMFEYPLNARWA